MTELYADMAALKVTKTETLTSGAAGAFLAHFSFSHAWDGMAKTAVFRPASCDCPTEVLLGADETCAIPWEVLRHPRTTLMAGVYGTRDGTIRLPTVWASLGTVQPGAGQGIPARPPAPDVYQQLLGLIGDLAALETTAKDSLVGAVNEVFNMGGGGGALYIHTQDTPAALWSVQHNLGKKCPNIVAIDGVGNRVIGDVDYYSGNLLRISFSMPVSGYAYLT